MTPARARVTVAIALLAGLAGGVGAQVAGPGTTFRVFLTDGHALPAYGEPVRVGDRFVFTLRVGSAADPAVLQLISLPLDTIDLEKTARYTEAMRAAHYAATRGEADYAAMTAEVQRSLDLLAGIEDAPQRLALAEGARDRLLAWSRDNYSYRAADIRELAALFGDVIGELRAAAGQSRFSLDLRAGPAAPAVDPLLPAPTLRESITLALAAAATADVAEDRAAVLRTVLAALGTESDAADLREHVRRELEAELAAGREYDALAATVRKRALAAMRAGDVAAVMTLRVMAVARDQELGGRRPAEMRALLDELADGLDRTRAHRLALDHYATRRRTRLAYERRVRPVFSGLDGLTPVLEKIDHQEGVGYERLEACSERLSELSRRLNGVTAPAELAGVHATLTSALHMADQGCARRRQAVVTTNVGTAREASAAAAGAMLLAAQARATLLSLLFPPRLE